MGLPNQKILTKYADLLVNFALNSGGGVKPGEVVYCVVPELAKPLYGHLQEKILRAQAHPIMRFIADGFKRSFFDLANQEQLAFFPKPVLLDYKSIQTGSYSNSGCFLIQ